MDTSYLQTSTAKKYGPVLIFVTMHVSNNPVGF